MLRQDCTNNHKKVPSLKLGRYCFAFGNCLGSLPAEHACSQVCNQRPLDVCALGLWQCTHLLAWFSHEARALLSCKATWTCQHHPVVEESPFRIRPVFHDFHVNMRGNQPDSYSVCLEWLSWARNETHTYETLQTRNHSFSKLNKQLRHQEQADLTSKAQQQEASRECVSAQLICLSMAQSGRVLLRGYPFCVGFQGQPKVHPTCYYPFWGSNS